MAIKLNNSLLKTSKEEQQSLQSILRGDQKPGTPMETKVLGGQPDQAKMAGTGQQKQGALRAAVSGQNDLATQRRTEQNRTQATEAEDKSITTASRLANLSGLRDRVGLATQAALVPQSQQVVGGVADSVEDPELQSLLEQFKADPTNLDLVHQINQKMGKTTWEEALTPEEIQEMFNLDTEALYRAVAEGTKDTLLVQDLGVDSLGADENGEGGLSIEELGSLLGIPAEELAGKTLAELQAEIQSQIEEEFNQVSNLQREVMDVNAGPAERAAARKQLRDLGAVGVAGVESDMDKLADQIENADTVEFMGNEMAVDELLDDEYISGLAAAFFDENTDPAWIAEFKKENPELADFLEENKNALAESIKNVDEGTRAYAELQYQNQKLQETPDGQGLSDDIMEQLIPGWGLLSAEEYNTDSMGIFQVLNDPKRVEEAHTLTENLRYLSDFNPELVGSLAAMSESQLRQLGILTNTTKWKQYKTYLDDKNNKLRNANLADPDSVYQAMFGSTATARDMQRKLNEYARMINSGIYPPPLEGSLAYFLGYTEVNGKKVATVPKTPEELLAKLTELTKRDISPADLLNGRVPMSFSDKGSLINTWTEQSATNSVYQKVSHLFDSGRTVTANQLITSLPNLRDQEEAYEMFSKNMGSVQREKLKESILNSHMKGAVENSVKGMQPTPSQLNAPPGINTWSYAFELPDIRSIDPRSGHQVGGERAKKLLGRAEEQLNNLISTIDMVRQQATTAAGQPFLQEAYNKYLNQLIAQRKTATQKINAKKAGDYAPLFQEPKQKQWHGLW